MTSPAAHGRGRIEFDSGNEWHVQFGQPVRRHLAPTPVSGIRTYRPDIDGLRALAVLSVVFYHAFPKIVRGGFVGVDVFFVISGYLISSLLLTDFSRSRFSLPAFYGRRIRRIFPALALCLASVLAYGFVCLLPSELAQLGKHVAFGAGFLANFANWSETGYFDVAAPLKPLLHLWSLGIEEQFYLIWPAILWLSFRRKANVGRMLLFLFVASFVINIGLALWNISDDFYLPISRFWELLAGAALAWRGEMALSKKTRSSLSWAGLATLLIAVFVLSPAMRFPGALALLPVLGAVMVIVAGGDVAANRIVFSNPAAVWIGLISYPLYIWHWPLLSFASVIRMSKPPTPLMALLLLAVAVLLAWGTYEFVERPVRFGKHRQRWTIVMAMVVALLGAGGAGLWATDGLPGRFPPLPGIDVQKISAASNDPIFKPTAGMLVEDRNGTLIARLGKGPRRVILSGDSLVFQYGPRVQQLADDGKLAAETIFVTGPSCAPVPGVKGQHGKFAHCAELPGLLQQVVEREKPQSIVLGASWLGYSSPGLEIERSGKRFSSTTAEGKDAFWSNLSDFVHSFQEEGVTVYLVRAVAEYSRFNPHYMVRRSLTGFQVAPDAEAEPSIAEMRRVNAEVDTRLAQISVQTGARLLDEFQDVCGSGETCSGFFGDGRPKFVDGMHLRPVFVRSHLHFLDFLLMRGQ